MKYYYIVVQIKENNKYYAYAVKVSDVDNLVTKLNINGIISAMIYDNEKQAKRDVDCFNKGYKDDNKYMFSEPF